MKKICLILALFLSFFVFHENVFAFDCNSSLTFSDISSEIGFDLTSYFDDFDSIFYSYVKNNKILHYLDKKIEFVVCPSYEPNPDMSSLATVCLYDNSLDYFGYEERKSFYNCNMILLLFLEDGKVTYLSSATVEDNSLTVNRLYLSGDLTDLYHGSFFYHDSSSFDLSSLYSYFLLIALCVLLVFLAIMFKRRRFL